MSEWRRVVRCCPEGHVAEVAFHGPAGDDLQVPAKGSRCPRCQGGLRVFTFRYEYAQEASPAGRWRVYMADGTPVAVASVVELSDGLINVAVARSDDDQRVEVGSWTWEQAMALADAWAEDALGREPMPSTPWLRDKP